MAGIPVRISANGSYFSNGSYKQELIAIVGHYGMLLAAVERHQKPSINVPQ